MWLLTVLIESSSVVLLYPYHSQRALPPTLEPFGFGIGGLLIALSVAIAWVIQIRRSAAASRPIICLAIASVPLISWVLRLTGTLSPVPDFAELIWLPTWTGISFYTMQVAEPANRAVPQSGWHNHGWPRIVLLLGVVTCGAWWYWQSCWYYDNFRLGYNDFGHFTQRLSNTLYGRGALVETPVLPRFWDHFNPGLLLLLPAWMAWPDVHQVFLWQALALSLSGYLIFRIALSLQHSQPVSVLFGAAWLVQPNVGQMNLAYTYGWHPISMAIPLLLVSVWALLENRKWLALASCLIALSMEEGGLVIVCLTAAIGAAVQMIRTRRPQMLMRSRWFDGRMLAFYASLSGLTWFIVSLLVGVSFVLIFRLSGLAEFQTGRFVSLGSTTFQVLLSPLLRPVVFWGSLFSLDRWYFILLLLVPCGLIPLGRGAIYLLPTLLPLGVLLVWDHAPAHCIAFQYPSTLLPLFWLAAISGATVGGAQDESRGLRCASMAFSSGLLMSLFLGQLPFSTTTLLEVEGKTYGEETLRRLSSDEDGQWLTQKVEEIRAQRPTVLATGRIAAHFVGMPDVETVGQYIERRERLAQLEPDLDPILRFQFILLDRREDFQQTRQLIDQVEQAALAAGFNKVAEEYDVVILRRP